MTSIITGADLRAIAPEHEVFSDRALASALHVSPHQIPELRRQADLAMENTPDREAARLMRNCGINRHEAETYLAMARPDGQTGPQGLQHG